MKVLNYQLYYQSETNKFCFDRNNLTKAKKPQNVYIVLTMLWKSVVLTEVCRGTKYLFGMLLFSSRKQPRPKRL